MTETYGQLVARLRGERGWSQEHLAKVSGVPKRTLQDVEGDKSERPQRATRTSANVAKLAAVSAAIVASITLAAPAVADGVAADPGGFICERPDPPTPTGEWRPTKDCRKSYTLVIGDSLTERGADKLAALHPDWVIDGVGGRGVNALGPVLGRHLDAEGIPSTVVMALGTNSGDGSWTKADYVAATKMVPASTSIVLVTLWRDPVVYGQVIADRLGKWSRWMTQIARDRPRTETAWWRAVAANHPELLADGVHATDPDGEAAWVAQVDAAVAR